MIMKTLLCYPCISDAGTNFTKLWAGCIRNDVQVRGIHHLYVEITLSGCKYLCEFLHDSTCTLIIFLPKIRSCILLPWHNIPTDNGTHNCEWAELHYKYRKRGKYQNMQAGHTKKVRLEIYAVMLKYNLYVHVYTIP